MRTPDSCAMPPESRAWPWIQESRRVQSYSHHTPRTPLRMWILVATKWPLPMAVAPSLEDALTVPASISVSVIVNEYEEFWSSIETVPLIFELVIFTPLARIVSPQLTVLRSITVPFAVIVQGPV